VLAHKGISRIKKREKRRMATKLCLRRERCDTPCVVQGPGEGDLLKKLRPVSAELGMWMTDTTDFCGMGIKDPKGKSWHEYDWGSDGGVAHSKSHNRTTVWLPEDQVPLWAMDIIRGQYGAWQKAKDISGALRFLGGKRYGPL
jgi:hypothetical protein